MYIRLHGFVGVSSSTYDISTSALVPSSQRFLAPTPPILSYSCAAELFRSINSLHIHRLTYVSNNGKNSRNGNRTRLRHFHQYILPFRNKVSILIHSLLIFGSTHSFVLPPIVFRNRSDHLHNHRITTSAGRDATFDSNYCLSCFCASEQITRQPSVLKHKKIFSCCNLNSVSPAYPLSHCRIICKACSLLFSSSSSVRICTASLFQERQDLPCLLSQQIIYSTLKFSHVIKEILDFWEIFSNFHANLRQSQPEDFFFLFAKLKIDSLLPVLQIRSYSLKQFRLLCIFSTMLYRYYWQRCQRLQPNKCHIS